MKMALRWYGSVMDSIPLQYIRQIPGVTGVVSALMDIPAGNVWPKERVSALKQEIAGAGLDFKVVESVNVHEDIKLGLKSRDRYIENYIETIKILSGAGIKVICYNFMPVFDWTRTNLAKLRLDGATTLFYDQGVVDDIKDPQEFADQIQKSVGTMEMAGWEPERMTEIKQLFNCYKNMSHDNLFENLRYFLNAVIPVCEKYDVKMAIHPDDPPLDIFGLPRIATGREGLLRILGLVDSPYNGLTVCSGSLGADSNNDLPSLIREFGKMKRIHFAHVRNLKLYESGIFEESAHLSSDGSFDMYEMMKAYYDISFDGYIRPDHGRMIWGEQGRAGYGLYDRALGASYLNGLWEAIVKNAKGKGVQHE